MADSGASPWLDLTYVGGGAFSVDAGDHVAAFVTYACVYIDR